jgi:hypothetical protein
MLFKEIFAVYSENLRNSSINYMEKPQRYIPHILYVVTIAYKESELWY